MNWLVWALISYLSVFIVGCGNGTGGNSGIDASSLVNGVNQNPSKTCAPGLACDMIDKINDLRIVNDAAPLIADEPCQQSAQAHANDMAFNDYFSHTGLDGSTPTSRVLRYGGVQAGENIALGPPDIDQIADLWMNSTGHRNNIVNTIYTRTGMGVAYGPAQVYWVQCFTN